MKVTVVRGGGIAGLVTTTSADTNALPPEQADALRTQVEGSGLMHLPARVSGPTAQPDAFAYQVTVEDGDRVQKVSLSEDALPPAVRSLISWLDSVPGREQRIAPPGA
ncbi:MAG: hypothetical protein M3179_10350 [Actinomycetota bacterium]|nr:hypothetical protein [Actinomycetota bacterium]